MNEPKTMTDFDTLHDRIDQWLTGVLPLAALNKELTGVIDHHAAALGERVAAYHGVLQQLMTRIEGAASFTEESCSFSQGDFAGSLHDWLRKLEARLTAS